MEKVKIGTIWLDACSGCHMSMLDMDERLLELSERIEMVYGPLVDYKTIPENVDVFLVSGSVSTDKEMDYVKKIRENTKIVASFGDCAVTGNLPSMRNPVGTRDILQEVYSQEGNPCSQLPGMSEDTPLPRLLKRARPVHEVIEVDQFIQGCPPHADLIHLIVSELLEGRTPRRGIRTMFG